MIKSPYPYFGGKSSVADLIWERFGNPPNYVEPFFGSGAVLLARPGEPGIETVNDIDGMICNFWRAVKHNPESVAEYADWPVNECDLHARHYWLVVQKDSITQKLQGDPFYCDPRIAGWWAWGMSCWIGSGFCSGEGPWSSVDGKLVKNGEGGIARKIPHLGNAGRGVNRQIPQLRNGGEGIHRGGRNDLQDYIQQLSDRLRNVRVCCGDWSRVCGPAPTIQQGITAVFLDPPYSFEAGRNMGVYSHDSGTVAHDVREWAIEWGKHEDMRIALCGYEGEHKMPQDWECVAWKARGGYGNQSDGAGRENAHRERIWFSPNCISPQQELF